MLNTCCAAVASPVNRVTPVALALAAMLAMSPLADAASIGHSRLVSAPGQPLSINIPIRELSPAQLQSLRVGPAPEAAWQQAGLVPPVELSSLQFTIQDGFTPDSRVVQVRSNQPFGGPVADLLLQVDTAAGSQLHQVSLLAPASHPGAVAGSAATASTSSSGVAVGAPAASKSIGVRKGDMLFSLARANAVDGVSVYQMMLALYKANPQAFIDSNMNLVKAGATLAIPDASALRAVSDREARRIFQQHAQAFAAYRDGIAARRGQSVQGGSTQQGTVSNNVSPTTAAPAVAAQDQVVLSSGPAADAAIDEQSATRQNINESQARVSQLERNVHSLNQALQMQGEAAKDAVVDGAAAVGQTLSEAAVSMGLSDETSGSSASASGAPGVAPTSGQTAQAGAGARVSNASVQGASEQGASGQGISAPAGAGQNAQQPGQAQNDNNASSGAPASVAAGSAGAASTGAAATGATATGAASAGAAGTASELGAAARASAGSESNVQARSQAGTGADQAQNESNSSSKAEQSVSWFQENLLGVITGILALVVLIIAWLLRRASASRNHDSQGGITEAMVQERLETIDFDLDSPPADQRPPHAT